MSQSDLPKLYSAPIANASRSAAAQTAWKPIPGLPSPSSSHDREQFKHLKYPPFVFDLSGQPHEHHWGDLRAEGFIGGKLVITKTLSGRGVDAKFALCADDNELVADGADATRVVMRVTDEFGQIRTYANDPIVFTVEGPVKLIGDNPFALIGGTGAVWVRAGEVAGTARITAKHPRLGEQTVNFTLAAVAEEVV